MHIGQKSLMEQFQLIRGLLVVLSYISNTSSLSSEAAQFLDFLSEQQRSNHVEFSRLEGSLVLTVAIPNTVSLSEPGLFRDSSTGYYPSHKMGYVAQ